MYKRKVKGWTKHLDFILFDFLCLVISFFCGFWIRHGFVNPMESLIYREMFIIALCLNFVIILFFDVMKNIIKRGYWKEAVSVIGQSVMLLLSMIAFLFVTKEANDYSRATISYMIMIYCVLTYLVRIVWKKVVVRSLHNSANNALLIIASEKSSEKLIEEVKSNNYGQHKIIGVVVHNDYKIGKKIKDVPIVATYENVIEYVTKNWVDEVLISIAPGEQIPEEIIDTLNIMGVTVHLNMGRSAQKIGVKQTIGNIGGLVVITSSMNFITPKQYFIKRTMDIIVGLFGCIVTGVLYLILAPAIKKQSPGPVFFTQERIGRNGKPFKIYKFRSMYLDAEERKAELMKENRLNNNYMFKMDFDPRVIGNRIDEKGNRKTGIGEFIRKFSLDEFPQFFNVLKGDMSLIGTRPPLSSEYAEYSAHHKARLAATPGITGLWQVSGRSDILDFEEVVQLDTQYINNWSIGLDLKILLKTVKVVLKKEGSM